MAVSEIKNITKLRNNQKNTSYEIEKIVDHKIENNNYIFLIKWKNYDESENTWINIDSFNEKQLLKEYLNEKKIIFKI